MKVSHLLALYASAWVKYFINEANINGVPYSKYRKYAYFFDGLNQMLATVKKILEQDFLPSHNHQNNIPISLKLNNVPANIASLAYVHGISLPHTHIYLCSASRSLFAQQLQIRHKVMILIWMMTMT